MRIVVIEDDIAIGFSLRLALEDRGYEVQIYEDPTLVPYDSEHADVILLDYYMPKMDGEAVLQRIRQSETLKNVRVILMSASPQLVQRARELKVEHMAKPFDLSTLYEYLEVTP
jgi:DNA-binding response OmpR family regulator